MDGFAMEFVSEKQALKSSKSKVVFAAGCFWCMEAVSYTHLRAHETVLDLVCRLLLEKKKYKIQQDKR